MWRRNLRAAGEPPPAPGTVVPPADNPQSGIYKTIDGGKSWQKCASGLPAKRIGRIGLALYLKDPNIVYAILDNQNPREEQESAAVTPAGQAAGRGAQAGRGGRGQR